MRIAYVGGDFFANCAAALIDQGHTISHIFDSGQSAFAVPVTIDDVARRCGVSPSREAMSSSDVAQLAGEVDVLVCAGYPHRIPIRESDALRAINVHPSPLPFGRGPAPFQRTILDGLSETAISIHQMVERFDFGPILLQVPVPVEDRDTTASLAFRCRAAAPGVLV
ncbi:MAG: formyltransferase family protein, partial [Tepidiformaceae bacterium]